jgi:hypothetical protein
VRVDLPNKDPKEINLTGERFFYDDLRRQPEDQR